MQQLNITQQLRKDIFNDISIYKLINFDINDQDINNGKYINLIQIQNKIYKNIICQLHIDKEISNNNYDKLIMIN